MKENKTHAILLKQTFLANDDAVLDFFTPEGKITLFVRKFQNSKKRRAQIDFFRLLEIEFFEGRNSKSLRSVSVQSVFNSFSENGFKVMETGFYWLEKLNKVISHEESSPESFQEIIRIFTHFDAGNSKKFDAFFRLKILDYSGVLQRFDQERGDVFFDARSFRFYKSEKEGSVFLCNLSRQIIEFMRRSDFYAFSEKINELPMEHFEEINLAIQKIEKWHE